MKRRKFLQSLAATGVVAPLTAQQSNYAGNCRIQQCSRSADSSRYQSW